MLDNRGLWRGKTTPKVNSSEFNNVWVIGNLIQVGDKYYIHPIANRVNVKNELGQLVVMHEVDPKTLGECTTLPDMRRNLIFEGDIVNYNNGLVSEIFRVVYNEKWARFAFTKPNTVFATFNLAKCEVIGNIHDNPELLKE